MKLYEINERIRELADTLDVDEETGEILGDVGEIMAELEKLQLQKSQIMEFLLKLMIENRADIDAIKVERDRLDRIVKSKENREERLKEIVERECCGVNFKTPVGSWMHRESKRVEITDEVKAVGWLQANCMNECLKYTAPTVRKTEVKPLLESGSKIPGCELVTRSSAYLRRS